MNVVEFLEARLVEDEHTAWQAVRRHFGDGKWAYGGNEVYVPGGGDQVAEMAEDADGHHIALHDPARVLRDVTANRAVIHQAGEATGDRGAVVSEFSCSDEESAALWAANPGDLILRSLASIYSDHPDFDPAWKVG